MSMISPDSNLQAVLSDPALMRVRELAMAHRAGVFLVGGAVRDALRTGQTPSDLDFAVTGVSAETLARQTADVMDGHYVLLDADFGIHRVVVSEKYLDIADALNGNILLDLARRDLTVNAMAVSLDTGEFLDPHDGRADLDAGIIRMVSEENLLDDTLRMLRVFRFAAVLETTRIDPKTLAVIARHKDRLLESAPERIHFEFLKMLSVRRMFPVLEMMGDCGLLEVILPELTPTRDVPPSGYHHLWLFTHTLELVNQAELLWNDLPQQAQAELSQWKAPFATRFGLVKMACLLHDIGKPDTMALHKDGTRHTFYGHDQVSEEMTAVICRRWRLSNEIADYLKKLVRWHLYPCQFGPESSRKAVLRFFRRMGDETPDVILLALADRFSTLGPEVTLDDLNRSHAEHLWLLARYYEEQAVLKMPRLLDGKAVMEILGMPPGKKIGEVLDALQEAHQLGEVTTEAGARAWVRDHFGV